MLIATFAAPDDRRIVVKDWPHPLGGRVVHCPGCGVAIGDETGRSKVGAIYCSDACRKATRAKAKREAYRPAANQPKTCACCGAEFKPARSDARFCSVRCRVAAHRAM